LDGERERSRRTKEGLHAKKNSQEKASHIKPKKLGWGKRGKGEHHWPKTGPNGREDGTLQLRGRRRKGKR